MAAQIADYRQVLGNRLPLVVLARSIVTTLVLIVVRVIVLPVISVALNLLTVGASFGVVALLFQGSNPVPGRLERLLPRTDVEGPPAAAGRL